MGMLKTKELVVFLFVRLVFLALLVVPVVVLGRALALPEIAISGIVVAVILAFAWFKEDLIEWMGARLGVRTYFSGR
ncbi:MAG TPA: hypothetical protein VFN89_11585 [Solirubrobacterales bacterium]|nr:hypothetical protein [Solirubrobacterales bacterium]